MGRREDREPAVSLTVDGEAERVGKTSDEARLFSGVNEKEVDEDLGG